MVGMMQNMKASNDLARKLSKMLESNKYFTEMISDSEERLDFLNIVSLHHTHKFYQKGTAILHRGTSTVNFLINR
jgi:hypothetical protein